jgi:hypothetical protein
MRPYIPTLNYIVSKVVLLQLLLSVEDNQQTLIMQTWTSQKNAICLTAGTY